MKFVAIFITLALFGIMGYLMMDARNLAKGAQNEMELMRRQQEAAQAERLAATQAADQGNSAGGKPQRPAFTPEQLAAAAREGEERLQNAAISAPLMPPAAPAPGAPVASPDATVPGAAPAPVAPLPPTPRQRQVMAAPAIAKVSEVEVESGFVVITAGSGRNIDKGMGFAIRRGDAIVGRVKVSVVEDGNAVADIVRDSIPPGVTLQPGDDVIQDLPPL